MIGSLKLHSILALFFVSLLVFASKLSVVVAFAPSSIPTQQTLNRHVHTALGAAPGGRKTSKRKRRRKQQPGTVTETPPPPASTAFVETKQEIAPTVAASVETSPPTLESSLPDTLGEQEELGEGDLAAISDVAKFEFKGSTPDITKGVQDAPVATEAAAETPDGAIPLPDIKEARKKKLMEEELAKMEQEQEEQKVRIKRSDKEAFAKVSFVVNESGECLNCKIHSLILSISC